MIGPDFGRPPGQVAEDWMEAGSTTIESRREHCPEWWSLLSGPVLSNLIELAYEGNLTLLAAGVRVREACAQIGLATGEFYPQQQQLGASASSHRIPVSVPCTPVSNTFRQPAFGAQVGWELDVWGAGSERAIDSRSVGVSAGHRNEALQSAP